LTLENERRIKEQLISHLEGGEAFLPLKEMLNKIPFNRLGEKPHGLPYSFYELFYHIRFAQRDILDYCTSEKYSSHTWPDDYWPKKYKPDSETEWDDLKMSYFTERKLLIDFILDPDTNLMAPVRDSEHLVLREVMLVIEHSAYHTGQLLMMLRTLGLYK